jgi:dipeptidyl aminopeptidase/acylaminoacyl peptidase
VLGAAALVLALAMVALLTNDSDPEVQVLQTPVQVMDEVVPSTPVAPEPEPAPAPPITAPPPPRTIPPRATAAFPNEAVVAFMWERDLWIQGRSSGRLVQVTPDGGVRWERSPTFRSGRRLAFSSTGPPYSTIEEIDLDTGAHRVLAKADRGVTQMAWSPDGSALAFLGGADNYHHIVNLLSADTGAVVAIRDLGWGGDRGGFWNADQVHVAWSPDGTKLLVVNSVVAAPEWIWVLHPDGRDVVSPRSGLWANWSRDSRTVYLVENHVDKNAIVSLDTVTGTTATLPTPGPVRRLAISPSGTKLAYDDGAAAPTVSIYDLEHHTTRPIWTHALGPVWISPDSLFATVTAPCVPNEASLGSNCNEGSHGSPWTEQGRAWEIGLDGTAKELPAPRSTLEMAFLNG